VHKKIAIGIGTAAAALSALTFAVTPAFADVGTATIQGAGQISPGLTTTPTSQSFTFTGTGPVIDANNASLTGVYTCNVSGSSSAPETSATGAGTFGGTCSGPATVSVTGNYTRDGGTVVVTGGISGPITASFTGACVFAPTSAPTVTSFRVACHFALKN
jgi:hypothetical protein